MRRHILTDEIVKLRAAGLSLAKVGKRVGLSIQQVRSIEVKAAISQWSTAKHDALSKMPRTELLLQSVTQIPMTVRAFNCLASITNEAGECLSIGELISFTPEQLLSLWGFGKKSLDELQAILASWGLRLADDVEASESSCDAPGRSS